MTPTTELATEIVPQVTNPKTYKTMSNSEKMRYIKEVITVEPLIGLYGFATVLCSPALNHLKFEKACRVDVGYKDTICEEILNDERNELYPKYKDIELIINNVYFWPSIINSIVTVALILFLGSYSDRYKLRKPFLLLPIFGDIFAMIGCIFSVFFLREWPLWTVAVFQAIPSFFGGQPLFMMAIFSYIADVTTLEMRTLRIGIVQIVFLVCFPLVHYFNGILFMQIGYYGIFLLTGGIYLAALLYGLLCVKETGETIEGNKIPLKNIFAFRNVTETINILYKKVSGFRRVNIILLMVVCFLFNGVIEAENKILVLYVEVMYAWKISLFSNFGYFKIFINFVGIIIGLPLFVKVFKLSDYNILILCLIDKLIGNIVIPFGRVSTILLTSTVISMITGLSVIVMRSMASKIVSEDNIGKSQSLLSVCEVLGPIIITSLNLKIFEQTINSYPHTFILTGAILFGICTLLTIIMFYVDKSIQNEKVNLESQIALQEDNSCTN